jgi:hypothetical protein
MMESYDLFACVFNGHTSEVNVILLRSEDIAGSCYFYFVVVRERGTFSQIPTSER